MMSEISQVRIFVGGQQIDVDGIKLHSAAAVAKWQNLSAQAQSLFGTFSTGIGIWGSPGVALAGAAALGFLEAAVTSANQKQGFHILGEALALHERLTPRGVVVPVNQISGIQFPVVSRWNSNGAVASEMDVRSLHKWQLAEIKKNHSATDEELAGGFLVRDTMQDLVILPDEFVTCQSGSRTILVKWSSVDTYEPLL